MECLGFANDYGANAELPDKTAAIPTWRERRDHDRVAVTALAAGFAKRVRFAMYRRIAILHAPIVTAAQQVPITVEQRRPDRHTAFRLPDSGLFDSDIEQRLSVDFPFHILKFYRQTASYANLVTMSQNFQPGDFLVFQLEAGFALLRLLAVDEMDGEKIWHIAAYGDFFLDVETAEAALADLRGLSVNSSHLALTNRAFESTQVARIANIPLVAQEIEPLDTWRNAPNREVSDRSVRLMLGLR